jgi:hypothetical protein
MPPAAAGLASVRLPARAVPVTTRPARRMRDTGHQPVTDPARRLLT